MKLKHLKLLGVVMAFLLFATAFAIASAPFLVAEYGVCGCFGCFSSIVTY